MMDGTAPVPKRKYKPSRTRFTAQQIEAALRSCLGNLRACALHLERELGRPCSRQLLQHAIRRTPRLAAVIVEITEEVLDIAESAVMRAMLDGDANIAMRVLETKGKGRGYTRQMNIGGVPGSPIEVTNARERLSEELRQIRARIGPEPGHGNGVARPDDIGSPAGKTLQ